MSPIAFLLVLAACAPETRPADEYCERTVESFCDYYLRCGRMAEDTPEDCENTFLETCNTVYEPHYVALEADGLLQLSTQGMKDCADHLEQVACDEQMSDLQGCDGMWVGLSDEGDPCGLGIESFVCDAETTCAINLELCGTCVAAVPLGGTCAEEDRCRPPGECVGGTCVEGGVPGDPCDEVPCRLVASCVEGICTTPPVVGVGDDCDLDHRCPYKSACIGGVCVESSLQGGSCGTEQACASGWCDDGTCAAFRGPGEVCDQSFQCQSGQCGDDGCTALPGACFE